jgi:hypothetical protein
MIEVTTRFSLSSGQNNAMVLLSCMCNLLAMFVEELASVADVIDFIADIVTAVVSSCLLAQTHLEVQ